MYRKVKFKKEIDSEYNVIIKYNNHFIYIKGGTKDIIEVYKASEYLYIFNFNYELNYIGFTIYSLKESYLVEELIFDNQSIKDIEVSNKLRKDLNSYPRKRILNILNQYTY